MRIIISSGQEVWQTLCPRLSPRIVLCISRLPSRLQRDLWCLPWPYSFLWRQWESLRSGIAEMIDLVNANSLMFIFSVFDLHRAKYLHVCGLSVLHSWGIVHMGIDNAEVLLMAGRTAQQQQPLPFKNVMGRLSKSVNNRRNSRSGIRLALNFIQF